MKSKNKTAQHIPLTKFITLSLGFAVAGMSTHSAQAATQYWDTTTTANVQPGSGTWGTDSFWTTDGAVLGAWTSGSVAVFAGDGATASSSVNTNAGTDATAEGVAITLGSAQSATQLFFNNTGFILQAASAQTLTLTSVSPVMSIAAGKSASIGNNVTVDMNFGFANNSGTRTSLGAGSVLNINSGGTLTRTASLTSITGTGTNGTIGFVGAGTVNIAGTFSNSAASQGTQGGIMLATTASDAIVVNVNSGGLVQSTIGGNGLMMTNILNSTATLNLNTGGTVFVQKVSEGTTTTGTSNFNFDGGTLKASVNKTNFMTGLDSVKIKSGGAIIDTNTFDVTIGQNLLTDAVSTGGGLTKSSAGTLTLAGANTYTGATSINAGTLALGASGSIANSPVIAVRSGATLDVSAKGGWSVQGADSSNRQTLTGSGSVTGATTIGNFGTHNAGDNGVGKQTLSSSLAYDSGSIFEWDLAATPATTGRGTAYDAVNAASLGNTTGAIFRVVLNGAQDFSATFWDTTQTWTDIFKTGDAGTNLSFASIFSGGVQYYNGSGLLTGVTSTEGAFTMSGNTLTWSAVPEPTTALSGLLLTAGLLRRRRKN